MRPKRVRIIASWLCVLLILAIPCVPFVYRWFNPPKTLSNGEGFWGMVGGALDILGSLTDSLAMLVSMMGLGAAAFIASLVAVIAACVAGDPWWIRGLCALPVLAVTVAAIFTIGLPLLGIG